MRLLRWTANVVPGTALVALVLGGTLHGMVVAPLAVAVMAIGAVARHQTQT
jgi:hypothetical protein